MPAVRFLAVALCAPLVVCRPSEPNRPVVAAPVEPARDAPGARVWDFDRDKLEVPPDGFSFGRTGRGRLGRWTVKAASDAVSRPNVLVQLEGDPTPERTPVAAADGLDAADVAVSVSCKILGGTVNQTCGVLWRYEGEDDYRAARIDALDDTVTAARVERGKSTPLGSFSGKIVAKRWHTLTAVAKGPAVLVLLDGKKVIETTDPAPAAGGKVGVTTQADSVVEFDDLIAVPPAAVPATAATGKD